MAGPIDVPILVLLPFGETEIALTAHFNGGPILVTVDSDNVKRTLTFAADPFFRRQNHNISIGSLLFRIPDPANQISVYDAVRRL